MSLKNVYSVESAVENSVDDIKNQIGELDTKMLVYFASSNYDQEALSKKMQESFPNSVVFGCSTSGEIISGRMLKDSIVAMAFDSNSIEDVKVEVVEHIKEDDENVRKAFESFENYYGNSMKELDITKYVGMVLFDGLSGAEEKIMEKIGDLTNITFVGGSAGDDLKFEQTYIHVNGKVYTNAALLALLKPTAGFDIIKTQSFKALNKRLIATKVDEENRTVIEFNNKPAVQAYADALGISVNEVENKFMSNPVGLVVGREIFVRSPQRVIDDTIKFYCNISEGMETYVLESTDIVKDTIKAVKDKKEELDNISGLINFHCILRTLELEQRGLTKEYGNIFVNTPTIGFSTYGESYIGHINQTSTMLVLK